MQYAPSQYSQSQNSYMASSIPISAPMDIPISMPMSMPTNRPNPAVLIVGIIMILVIFGAGGYAIYYYASSKPDTEEADKNKSDTEEAAISTVSPGSNTMKADINYSKIMKAYSASNGFGSNRNTAIVIVGEFMAANKLPGSPMNIPDANLYLILSANDADSAFNELMKVIQTTSMQQDANYQYALKQYIPGKGFGDAVRNMAIVMTGNFMKENGISGDSPQSFSDEKLYNILMSNSPAKAKELILK